MIQGAEAADPHLEQTATVVGAVRDLGPVVKLAYDTLRSTISPSCSVVVADNGSDVEAVTYLRSQPWLQLVTLTDRLALADAEHEVAQATLSSLWEHLDTAGPPLSDNERVLLDRLRGRVRTLCEPSTQLLAQHGTTLDYLLTTVDTTYTIVVDADVEFLKAGWLTDTISAMDEQSLDLYGFLEPASHPLQRRFATYVLALRTETVRRLGCSFEPDLTFDDEAESAAWHSTTHEPNLDTTAFARYPSARFYDTAARLYEAAQAAGLRYQTFPDSWIRRFRHLGHMSWSADITDNYGGAEQLRSHRRNAIRYARWRCQQLGLGQ